MKPAKIEDMLNLNPPPEDTKGVPFPLTYYQPFPSTFDPECPVVPHQNPFLINRWGNPATDGPPQGPARAHCPLPSAPLLTISTPTWGDPDRRSICSSPWPGTAPGTSRPPLPGLEDCRGPFARPSPGAGPYSQFPASGKHEVVFRAVRNCRPDARAPFRTGTCPGPVQKGDGNRYFPFMLSPLGRNASKNISKAVPPGHGRPMVCNFCKNNKEVPDIYLNHYLYDPETKVLSCPVLRKHVCEICGGTGDQAHTLQYCPVNRERGLQAKVPVLLKTRTITNSTGKIRRN